MYKLFRFFIFNMHSNIYSCLFHDANIKEENIIIKNTQSLLRLLGGLHAMNELENVKSIISKHSHRN